jgi:hypothetical protein
MKGVRTFLVNESLGPCRNALHLLVGRLLPGYDFIGKSCIRTVPSQSTPVKVRVRRFIGGGTWPVWLYPEVFGRCPAGAATEHLRRGWEVGRQVAGDATKDS